MWSTLAVGDFDLGGYDNVVDAVIGIITRHPMSQAQLERALTRWAPEQVDAGIGATGRKRPGPKSGAAKPEFWTATSSHFPDEEQSLATAPER